jgi:aryl-alcohol dehydrogenase-like predicted oxidoreductase
LAVKLRDMDVTRTAYGIWSGGRFMHFGEPLEDARFLGVIRHAYDKGIRTFMTADVYGNGQADEILGRALAGVPRDSYCLVGAVGHDFYTGKREGAKGYPRFTNPALRPPEQFAEYVRSATEKSLQRCGVSYFDLLMLHNPDSTGFSSEAVWKGLQAVQSAGLTRMLGIAPGPANGFTLDIIHCFEQFGFLIDWAMIILNPLEPWPGELCLPAAVKHGVKIITRVVDYGGLFHDDVHPGHVFRPQDHRVFRPAGWVEAGHDKMEQMRATANKYGVTMLQLACLWNLSHEPVRSVIPTLIQEAGADAKPIEKKVEELAGLSNDPRLAKLTLTPEERDLMGRIGNNTGCMNLKGANPAHAGGPEADHWALRPELIETGRRWGIDPARDLTCTHSAA